MKILLTVPMNRPPGISFSLNDNGLGYIASACKKAGAEVRLFSWNINLTIESFKKSLADFKPDVVGVKVFTTHFKQTYELLSSIRKTLPKAITIIGGPHPSTSSPDRLFIELKDLIDFAIAGEGEVGIMGLVEQLRLNNGKPPADTLRNVPGLIYKDGERVVCNKKKFQETLDKLPQQDWEIQDPRHFDHKIDHANKHAAAINDTNNSICSTGKPSSSVLFLDSRGCSGRCGHCMSWLINGSIPRLHSTDFVINELDKLINEYNVKTLEFTGNSFFFDIDFVRDICKWLISKDVPINWGCTGAAYDKNLNPDILSLMYRAGCTAIHYGIETGNVMGDV